MVPSLLIPPIDWHVPISRNWDESWEQPGQTGALLVETALLKGQCRLDSDVGGTPSPGGHVVVAVGTKMMMVT